MKCLFLNLLFCMTFFSNLQAWEVVMTKEGDGFHDPEWELQIPARDEPLDKDDLDMWLNIDVFIDIIKPLCDFPDAPCPYNYGPDQIRDDLLKCTLHLRKPDDANFGTTEERMHRNQALWHYLRDKGFHKKEVVLPLGFWFALAKLTFLKNLTIHGFKMKDLPENIINLKNLYALHIHGGHFDQPLAYIPNCFPHLEKLALNLCNLETLPTSINNLQNLRHLSVEGNALEALPHEIGDLTNLQTASFKANRLTMLPDAFINLQNLKYLDLSYNAFAERPQILDDLEALQEINLNNQSQS